MARDDLQILYPKSMATIRTELVEILGLPDWEAVESLFADLREVWDIIDKLEEYFPSKFPEGNLQNIEMGGVARDIFCELHPEIY